MRNFSGLSLRASLVLATVFLTGMWLGLHLSTHPADAAAAGKIQAFSTVINGKLDSFAPGVDYKTIATENGADFSATQITSIKRHTHNHSTEFLYVVSGKGTMTLGSTKKDIGPGDMISVPMGTPHGFTASGAPVRFVEVDVPSIAANDTHYMR